jgi:hypothetical protein
LKLIPVHIIRSFLLAGAVIILPVHASALDFPQGTATSPEVCGKCHKAIYQEFAYGFGSDICYKETTLPAKPEDCLKLPAGVSGGATAHAIAGVEPFPVHAREAEEAGKSCNVCHYPEPFAIPDMETLETAKPKPRTKEKEAVGLTCASCHLTPEGKIRGPYGVTAPHETVADPAIQTSAMCAYCHSLGKRVPGKQTQTFFEWREDFHKPGLGKQHCQDCHMPRTVRKLAEDFDFAPRAVARHLWTGGHSFQRLQSALGLVAVQPVNGKASLSFHVINIGAGHSVPTGSNRRSIYLIAEAIDKDGKDEDGKEWMFAPWYGPRPDDKSFLEEDKKRPDKAAAMQADAQGPHEAPIRAGEERILSWDPDLGPGVYTVKARLVYDLNRYNDRKFTGDQTEFYRTELKVEVK